MKKNQNTNLLKVRKGTSINHNETKLKVHMDWPISTNHNQSVLKVRSALQERWLLFVYKNCQGLTMNHNQIGLKVRK